MIQELFSSRLCGLRSRERIKLAHTPQTNQRRQVYPLARLKGVFTEGNRYPSAYLPVDGKRSDCLSSVRECNRRRAEKKDEKTAPSYRLLPLIRWFQLTLFLSSVGN